MDKAKIRLSPEEQELVINAGWILTKNGILRKVDQLLGQVQTEQAAFLQSISQPLPVEVLGRSAKISKGENYQGLPYLVLDYPRFFEKNDHFAIRTMFWWGHFFSVTLHLSGKYKERYANRIAELFESLKKADYYICTAADPWQHHFEEGNYSRLGDIDETAFRNCVRNNDFIKLATKFPLSDWDNSGEQLLASFSRLIEWISD